MKVFISRRIPQVGLDLITQEVSDVDIWSQQEPPSYEVMLDRCHSVDGVLTMLSDRIDAHFLHSCKNLKVVSNFAVGLDNIDVDEAKAMGILVGNTPDVLTEATSDLTLALMLNVARKVGPSHRASLDGFWKCWEPTGYLGLDMTGKTLGIFGMGRIGSLVAQKCHRGWGMKIIYCSRRDKPSLHTELAAQRVDWPTFLAESDFISLHADLNQGTEKIFNISAFERMKRSCLLVNTARGKLVETEDLLLAIRKGLIWGTGLDVTDPEPLPVEHPLWQEPQVLITPHIGSATFYTRDQMAILAAKNLLEGLGQTT